MTSVFRTLTLSFDPKTKTPLIFCAVAGFLLAGQAFGGSIQYTMTTFTNPNFTPIAISGNYIAGDLIVAGVVHAAVLNGGTLTDLGAGPGGVSATVLGVNSAGQVVGQTGSGSQPDSNGGSPRAILWSGGTVTDITPAGVSAAAATGINSSGEVVGINFTIPNAPSDNFFVENISGGSATFGGHDYLYGGGILGLPGAGSTIGTFVNANGDVLASPFSQWEYLDIGGSITTIEPPPAVFYGAVTGFNSTDEVIGNSEYRSDQPFGYSFDPNTGTYTALGFCPTAINDADTIVGDEACALDANVGGTPEVSIAGVDYLLSQIVTNLGGVTMWTPIGINADGQILGYGTSSTGAQLTYLLTETDTSSTPEPATSALFGSGIIALLCWKRFPRR